jgi:hypothetical protein
MNAIGEKVMDKVAAAGAAVTGTALFADWIQLLNGIGEMLLTWVGVATGIFTAIYYVTKFLDWLEQRKQKRHAKLQRTIESETSDL